MNSRDRRDLWDILLAVGIGALLAVAVVYVFVWMQS